ncbi:MAG: DNA repair protein RecN [Bdellovibrionota bacterium]|nr:DNA repair protein RecN [Pseudobdellovibrionaceae bacterium]|tara:strand:+ start:2101 stop:3789 length:1689 start_codon:yes stop_codon:yes gene_type:complete
MLAELRVNNFAIIDRIDLQFKSGFNILSGETGAGKSVLLKSLSLLMGAKASSDLVRFDAEFASIEGFFDVTDRPDIKKQLLEMGIACDDNELVVRRIIGKNGKSKVYLNSSLSTVHGLNRVVHPMIQLTGSSAPLIEITGQHDSKNLLDRSYHLDILDLYAGLFPKRETYLERYEVAKELRMEIEKFQEGQMFNEQKLDFLSFQIREIESMNLVAGEEEDLEADYKKMKNSQKLQEFLHLQQRLLEDSEGSALTRLQKAEQSLNQSIKLDPALEKLQDNLEKAKDFLSEYLYDLQSYSNKMENSELDVFDVEERLSRFRKLQKKYGQTSEEILKALDDFKEEQSKIENFDSCLEEKQKKLKNLELELKSIATDLHKKRKKAALAFTKKVNQELKDLNMNGFEFSIEIDSAKDFDRRGNTELSFVCKTASAEKARPLHKTASGGELSRILLSLKKVIGNEELPRTYLFDEVDTGVSGETAEKVGKKLREIAENQQLICVTHLPQVAAQGTHHFKITKKVIKGKAHMQVESLNKKDRIDEIARLISGEKRSRTSLTHAKDLLGY